MSTKQEKDKGSTHQYVFTYIDPRTGKETTGIIGSDRSVDNYYFNNPLRRARAGDVEAAINYILQYGEVDLSNEDELYQFLGVLNSTNGDHTITKGQLKTIYADAKYFLNSQGITNEYWGTVNKDGIVDTYEDDPQQAAFNSYYQDLYSLNEGTLGAEMLNNLATAEQNAAMSNMQLADAQYQQAAMQQAEAVKAITDQVRAERMSRLRAGMSESQIANQDMQIMLNNMNTLNQQANTMNANRLAAQQQYDLAQDTAYQQYLTNATGLGSVGAAMAASDAGDAYMQTLKRMNATGESYKKANKYVTGQTSTK